MTRRIDHVVINVGQKLNDAADCYRRLGFTITPRGHHSRGTSNHLAVFGSDYLELMGIEEQNAGRAELPYPSGLMGLVFKTPDADALWDRLSGRNMPLQGKEPAPLSRPIRLEDGTESEARFRTIDVDAAHVPNGRLFFCHQLTPELVWRPEWQRHANGVQGIAEYAYVTPDPSGTSAILEQAYGPGAIDTTNGGVMMQAGQGRVLFLKPDAIASRFGLSQDQLPAEAERALALTLYTQSLEQVRTALQVGEIDGWTDGEDLIVVPPAAAMGVVLAFRQA